jgi:uncharacterized protein
MSIDIQETISRELSIVLAKVSKTVQLLDQGNTIPFIARYRKEMTGELDEAQIRNIDERLKYYRKLEERKASILKTIEEQGKLNPELEEKIGRCSDASELEDLYLPFRPKKKTRASAAREKGLEPLASFLLACPVDGEPLKEAEKFVGEGIEDAGTALQGAMDIIAELISEDADLRKWLREFSLKTGVIRVKARDLEKDSVYTMYYDYQEAVSKIVSHRILAINRGEKEDFLSVGLEVSEEKIIQRIEERFVKKGATEEYLQKACLDAYRRLLSASVERDIRRQLTEDAQEHAMQVFARNLRGLLLQSPVREKIFLGLDPAYRTGCKWAVADETGKLLEVGVIYPVPPQNKVEEAKQEILRLIEKYAVKAIVIGNGTASRETEKFVADFIRESNFDDLSYTITSEAGASVYSASELAAREFPGLDVSHRSAISIARRVQDPLAELVKIPPQAVGVGQYQHDMAEKRLAEKLGTEVESVVNYVGVDLNTASVPLLSYVAGVNSSVAANIVEYRETNGKFKNRRQLLKVKKLGQKTFEQCAGFLRINQGDNPLDNTSIHPESYKLATKLLDELGIKMESIKSADSKQQLEKILNDIGKIKEMAESLDAGMPTVKDIIASLLRPGRDPREELSQPVFRTDILKIEDLSEGMCLKGTVRNVVDFGAFVDIGLKEDGLVHISEMADRFVKDPMDVVSVGEHVDVKVLSIDKKKGRIGLSMKGF